MLISYPLGQQIKHTVQGEAKLASFLEQVLPDQVPMDDLDNVNCQGALMQTREELVADVVDGIKTATMSTRMTPYILSRIDWNNPRNDPVFRQFIPVKSRMLPDHPKLKLDSLDEHADSPVSGLVHRYTDKALFLRTSMSSLFGLVSCPFLLLQLD